MLLNILSNTGQFKFQRNPDLAQDFFVTDSRQLKNMGSLQCTGDDLSPTQYHRWFSKVLTQQKV